VDRSQKKKLVDSLHDVLSKTELVVITQQSGMTVAEVTTLRRQMREAGASFKVTKNRLARRALEGTKFAKLAPLFKGPTAVAYSTDPVAAAKVAVSYQSRPGPAGPGQPARSCRRCLREKGRGLSPRAQALAEPDPRSRMFKPIGERHG